MTKRLRRIPQLLATPRNLLAEHAQMVAITQHVLENIDRPRQVFLVVRAGPRQRLHQPERAHGEGALAAADAVVRLRGVVAVHEPGGREAALLRGQQDAVDGADEARVVGRDEEDERRDEDRGVEQVAALVGLGEAAQRRRVAARHDVLVELVADREPFGAVGAWPAPFVGEPEAAVEGDPEHYFGVDEVLLFVADFPD